VDVTCELRQLMGLEVDMACDRIFLGSFGVHSKPDEST
jgi:hypothetical protein